MITKFNNWLKSEAGVTVVVLSALLIQTIHTSSVYVFYSENHNFWNWVLALGFGIVWDVGVLVFVLSGWKKEAVFMSVLQVVMNILYFYLQDPGLENFLEGWLISGAIIISIAFPFIIAKYTDLVINIKKTETQKTNSKIEKIYHDLLEQYKDEVSEQFKGVYDELVVIREEHEEYTNTVFSSVYEEVKDIEILRNKMSGVEAILTNLKIHTDKKELYGKLDEIKNLKYYESDS